jgi:hypothetical protein
VIRSTIRRACKRHVCGGVPFPECTGVIEPGDLYGLSVASPQHDDYGNERWWVMKSCLPCARHYTLTFTPAVFATAGLDVEVTR